MAASEVMKCVVQVVKIGTFHGTCRLGLAGYATRDDNELNNKKVVDMSRNQACRSKCAGTIRDRHTESSPATTVRDLSAPFPYSISSAATVLPCGGSLPVIGMARLPTNSE
jgi:hypothetical protein